MDIVGFALRFQRTFYVLALMMRFLGGSAMLTMPKNFFPKGLIPELRAKSTFCGLAVCGRGRLREGNGRQRGGFGVG